MASRPRCFRALEPVEIELRCAWRVKLLDDEVVANELKRIIAFEAARCQVRCLALTIEVNHLHLVLAQEMAGHDPARRRGIAAMIRNVESRASHWLNARYSLQGRLWERSYKSFPRGDAAQVLKSITYTVMNPVKHGAVKRAEDYEFNDADVYFFGKADGIVTHVPAMWSALGRTPEERAKKIKELMEEVWTEGVRDGDLLKAAHRAIARRAPLGGDDPRRYVGRQRGRGEEAKGGARLRGASDGVPAQAGAVRGRGDRDPHQAGRPASAGRRGAPACGPARVAHVIARP